VLFEKEESREQRSSFLEAELRLVLFGGQHAPAGVPLEAQHLVVEANQRGPVAHADVRRVREPAKQPVHRAVAVQLACESKP
jgi:hypothetical protein